MELNSAFESSEVKAIGWIDIHTHLNFLDISGQEAVDEASALGIQKFITIGTETKDLPVVQKLAADLSPHVFCTLGIHPHEGIQFEDEVDSYLREKLKGERVVAVGEIGLDYYYDNSPRDKQLEAFRRQMQIAADMNLPVEIHTRDAEEDTIEILNEYKGKVRGVIHCFTGTQKLATAALDCGYNISFSGIVTFKSAQELREVAQNTPLDRMHVETDAPFLSPVPVRGKKNRPHHMLWTAQLVAELKKAEISAFCSQMKENALDMFPKLQW